ncbi:Protein F57B10.9 [Aphelenchoides avenae]|nr:Protein F57B10.9 [Aphelenchus avenae]
MPGKTTVLKNELGVYVVPNPTPEHPNMFVGIILPRDIDKRLEDEFLVVLRDYAQVEASTLVRDMTPEERLRTSEKIALFLIRGGDRVAQEVQNLANKTGGYMAERGERYRANMTPTEDAVNINPAIRHGVYVMHRGGKAVAKVTRFLLDKIGDIGVSVGRQLANGVSGESGGGRLIKSTVIVVGGGLTSVGTVWIALENASKTLFSSMANETVQTVKIKYGDQASETTDHALRAVGHTTLAGFQLYDLGPRAIAGRMARKAGIQFVRDVGGSGRNSPAMAQSSSSTALQNAANGSIEKKKPN